MHLDNLFKEIGDFGRYQILRVTIISVAKITVVPSVLMMGFAGFEPDWWCVSHEENSDQTNITFLNGSFKNCEWNGTCHRVFSTSVKTIASEWNLVCEQTWITNIVTSVQMGGLLIGGIISGYSADSYGRKKIFYSGLLLLCIANAIASFSVSWAMFAVLRVFIGAACALVLSTLYLFQIEFVGGKWRMFIAALPDWALGMILQSLLAKWFHHWKWLHLALAASVAPMVLTYLFVDESVRWLAIKGQLKEARRVISKMAAMNRRQIPDTSILELIAEEEQAEGDKAKNYTYRDLFKTLDLTKKTVVTCFSWFSLSIIYYGIYFGVKELSGDLYLNMLLMALTELPLTPILPLISIRCGRRAVTMIGLLLTSGACFGLAVCTRYIREQERGTYINALANTAKLTASISWCAIMTFGAEQFPTVIRNQAYAAQCTAARVGGLFAAQVLSLGGNDDLMVPFLAMGILSFLTTLMFLPLEETRGKPLQDTMKTFTAEKHKHALPRETVSHEMAVLIYQTKTEK